MQELFFSVILFLILVATSDACAGAPACSCLYVQMERVIVQDSAKHLLLRAYEGVNEVASGDSGCEHRPMRNCSEQVLNSDRKGKKR